MVKYVKASRDGRFWYGIPEIYFIWNGEWNDPEIAYDGLVFNIFSIGIENMYWDELKEELGREPTDDEFAKYSLQCVTTKSSLSVNWVQYSLAEYFLKNYEKSLHLIDSVLKSFQDTMKKQEMHEVLIFKSNILFKLNRFQECIDLLEKNMNKWCVDRATFIEKIINSCVKINNVEKGIEYCKLALKINPENIFTYLNYFNLKVKDLNLTKYEDLFTLEENSKFKYF